MYSIPATFQYLWPNTSSQASLGSIKFEGRSLRNLRFAYNITLYEQMREIKELLTAGHLHELTVGLLKSADIYVEAVVYLETSCTN